MSDNNKASLRIDWFDGALIEDSRANTGAGAAGFENEDRVELPVPPKPQYSEKKPIGFKRLLDLSTLNPPILTLEIAHRPGFWNLLDSELKGDFIVLIVKILSNIYASLERGEKTKIAKMLKTRFETSNFLELLKDYLIGLPGVRIVEKRMNSHLWDDASAFFNQVIGLCEGIYEYGGNSVEYLKNVHDLLEITETSALGVKEEHSETFSDNLFYRIVALKGKLKKLIEQNPAQSTVPEPVTTELKYLDAFNYKSLSIFPTKTDLLDRDIVKIQPNIVNGAYPNVEHYLDTQFRLLREDCFGPLREGICIYLENPSKRRHENIRVHPKVRIVRMYVTNDKVGHLVDIAWKDRCSTGIIDSKRYSYSKQLMFGSLLLFTSNNFETVLCATVLDSKLELLSEGYIAVAFQNPVSKKIFSEPYLMVESEVFFEPYHRVLKVIQNAKLDDLPMKKYIVDVQTETHPPAYLAPETQYTVQNVDNNDKNEISFPVLDIGKWPDSFGLDHSQMEAYSFALTREFAVIQGPPGTGKTFIGVKIASTLLKNLSLEGTPMLVICYTNHALDQFLEGILPVTKNIVRLGGQSRSKALEPYNLNNLRSKMKSKYSYLYASKRSDLERIYKEVVEVQTEIEKCEKEIICYKTLKIHIKSKNELKTGREDPILAWLFSHLEDSSEDDTEVEIEEWERVLDEEVGDKIDTCFSEQWAFKEIDSMLTSMKYVKDITDEHYEGQKMHDRFETHINKIRKRLHYFKKQMSQAQIICKEDEYSNEIEDLYDLSSEQRWKVYFSAVRNIKSKLMEQMNDLLDQHTTCSRELEEVGTLIDSEVMKTTRVVGVTTTTAARRHELMKRLLSPIVIVEEAAEVLEAHIVASLTHKCQHLILIGDHKQLRPTAAHYKLAKHYNLEISLFERMIRNGMHARTLYVQRRMRPCFVELIVPTIYDKLESHPSVYKYPNVRGMCDNLYFYSHDVFEDSEGLEDSWSHKNTLEAKWCVALANYLRQMKYTAEEITILATYTGQVTLIKELSKKQKLLLGVKITAVDSYQGEENRIVILSLVRSNRDGKIGFLSASNRICVALSRAKEGFYIFGNMNLLKNASPIWRHINDKLVAKNAIGKRLLLRCDNHLDNVLEVDRLEDLENGLIGFCLRICENNKTDNVQC